MNDNDYRNRQFSLGEGLSRRQAQKMLKYSLNSMEIMKNRVKVLSSHAEYNKFRQKYQVQKLQNHNQIHQEIIKDKKEITAIRKSQNSSLSKRHFNQRTNLQLKEGLSQAFSKVKQEKIDQYNELKQRSQMNLEFLAKRRALRLEEHQLLRQNVQKFEGQMRESIARYNSEKKEDLRAIKLMEKKTMCQVSEEIDKQIQELNMKEKQLVLMNSQSLTASRIHFQQYHNLYCKTHFGKSINLPEITKSTGQSNTTMIQ